MDRRTFIVSAGLLGAALRFPALAKNRTEDAVNQSEYISEGLLPAALMKDAALLAAVLYPGALANAALTTGIDRIYPGNAATVAVYHPMRKEDIPQVLEHVREDKSKVIVEQPVLLQLVYVLGSLSALAASRNIPNGAAIQAQAKPGVEASWFDTVLIERFRKKETATEETELYIKTMQPRFLLRLHTIKPDYIEGITWPERISPWRKNNNSYMESLAEGVAGSQPKAPEGMSKKEFYNADEPLLQLVHKKWNGKLVTQAEVNAAAASGSAESYYAKALADSVRCIVTALTYVEKDPDIGIVKAML